MPPASDCFSNTNTFLLLVTGGGILPPMVVLPKSLTHLTIKGDYEPVKIPQSLIKLKQVADASVFSSLPRHLKKVAWTNDKDRELITKVFKNPYVLGVILRERDDVVLKSEAFLKDVSQPLHVMAARGEFDHLRFAISTLSKIHFSLIEQALSRAQTDITSIYPILPIDAAVYANRLDIANYIRAVSIPKGIKSSLLVSIEATYQAGRHLNLEMLKFIVQTCQIGWNTQTMCHIIRSALKDEDEDRALEMLQYLLQNKISLNDQTNWVWYDDHTSPLYVAINMGRVRLVKFLLDHGRITPYQKVSTIQLIGTPGICATHVHHAIRLGNQEIIALVLGGTDVKDRLPIDHHGFAELIYSSVHSNDMNIVNMVLETACPFYNQDVALKFTLPNPFLPTIELSDKVLFGRIKTVENLLSLEKANRYFNPSELVKRGDLERLKQLTLPKLKYMPSQMSIVSTVDTPIPNVEMIKFLVTNKLIRPEGRALEMETNQNQLAIRLMWNNTIKRHENSGQQQQQQQQQQSDMDSLNCLKYFFEKKLINKEHLVNALIYWDGDQTIFTVIPSYIDHIKSLQNNLSKVIQAKLNNTQDPQLPRLKLYLDENNRPHFKHGVTFLIDHCTDKNYLERVHFNGQLPIGQIYDLISSTYLSFFELVNSFPYLFENRINSTSLPFAISSKQYDSILYFFDTIKTEEKFPQYSVPSASPTPTHGKFWEIYPIHVLFNRHNQHCPVTHTVW
ncbi:hypothetical protein DFA_09263 [Cavenderia fasciculata]|uniref:Ankyrin repeat-containing protein n=1 Tax=Cavenderia fasciculata TaxID=261658 RepID=F4Q751_CACFS|nr:uncharacterized protein DFA_09263 [Cavenderia fasciculata]EGG16233.1 hypothetical protein DFA_09263 [Cavenderia fasciculata]|eukprot:XP_004354617.1 hypothetical protein DFA_09263 [Cavenderia fasciculata]